MRASYRIFLIFFLTGFSHLANAAYCCGAYCEASPVVNGSGNNFCNRATGGNFYYTNQGTCTAGALQGACVLKSQTQTDCVQMTSGTGAGGYICSCPEGYEKSPDGCVPGCPAGQEKVDDPNHPDGGYCATPCPEGQDRIVMGTGQASCVELLDEEPCQEVLGQFNGQDICADASNECAAQGGSFGVVDFGSGEQAVCIPDSLSPPTCDPGELLLVTTAGGGGFACTPPTSDNCEGEQVIVDGKCVDPPEPPEEPEECGAGQIFRDGSCIETTCPTGTVQVNGSCIDDGCPEGQVLTNGVCAAGTEGECGEGETLTGGVCAPDTGPGDPIEGETKEPGTVSGGEGCDKAPICQGDAIECAILYQQWKTRCAAEGEKNEITSNGSCTTGFICKGDMVLCHIAEQAHVQRCSQELPPDVGNSSEINSNQPSALDQGDTDLTTMFAGVFNQEASAASCPASDQITVVGNVLEVSYTPFCNFAGMIRPVVLFFFSLLAFRIMLRAF